MVVVAMAGGAAAKHEPDVAVYLQIGSENPAAIGLAEGEARRMLGGRRDFT
jgi:hypothetical protein